MRIYFIGLPGSGKSTVAKLLSNKLNYKFIDMDKAIEARCNKTINDIFKDDGEVYFRNVESKVLNDLNNISNVVIACGGGIVEKNPKSNFKGLVIFLTTPLEIIEERLANDSTRPLMKNNSIYELAKKRNKLYEDISDITIKNLNLEETVDLILEKIKNEDFNH